MIKRIKDYFGKYTKLELTILLLVTVQIVYLMLFNIFRMKYVVHFDSSEYLVQVMQIWKQKTLLIEDYYYSTMLTWDMPTLIAVPFYGIFKDVFLAYGMANNVLILLFAALLNKLCNDLEYSKGAKWLVFLAIFTVYQYGFVDYIEELFVNGALYGFRILFMLVLMDVLVCVHKGIPLKKNIIIYICCLFGCYVCGISSGVFELGCCILPIVLFSLWDTLCKEEKISLVDFLNEKNLIPIIAAFACCAGVVTNYLLGFEGSSASQKTTIATSNMAENFANVLVSFFQLFGWKDESVVITSLAGILQLFAFAAAAVVIIIFVISTKISINKRDVVNLKVQKKYGQMVFCVFLVNVLLFFLADLTYGSTIFEYRYWLMVVVPVFIEIGMVYDWMKEKSYNHWVVLVICYISLLCLICGYKDIKMWAQDNGADGYEKLMDVAEEKGLDHIYVYTDFYHGRNITAFAKENMDVFAITFAGINDQGTDWIYNQLRMQRWGTYVKYDKDCMLVEDNRNLGVVVVDYIGDDYKFLTSRAKEIISIEETPYKLLIMDENYIDFVYGIPEEGMNHSRDYFNWGYDCIGVKLNETGYYQSTGEERVALQGSFSAVQGGKYKAVLKYETLKSLKDIPAYLMISVMGQDNTSVVYKQEMRAGQTETYISGISIEPGDTYAVSVLTEEGTCIILEQIDYYKEK